MKKLALLLVFQLFLYAETYATHIVGGEFEIQHIEGDRYLFRQIQYFDVVNGDPRAKDLQVVASVFRKKDNVFVQSVVMQLQSENYVPYTNPQCTFDRLVTNRLVYTAEYSLNPELFSDPQGYYMVWERCCRNNIINNIVRPEETGQTFYIEFPPIRKAGVEFRNSTPRLFPPLSDYACVNRFYYVDFRGFDNDGDSLVYSLTTPFNTSNFEPLPVPSPAPHPFVAWIPGINSDYQIPGTPTLNIDKRGFLTVTPSEEGLFVFSVRCDEFRDGQKIGSVVRDFQLFVIDCPDPGSPPKLQAKTPQGDTYSGEIDTLKLALDDDRCIELKISDPDGGQQINLRAVPVNFEGDLSMLFSETTGSLANPVDSMTVQFCLPDCPLVPGQPAIIDIIAEDFTCPLPLMDTFRLVVLVEPPPNQLPKFITPVNDIIYVEYDAGAIVEIPFIAVDDDLDSLSLEIVGDGFDLEQFGMVIDTVENKKGYIKFNLLWNADCGLYPFDLINDFKIKFYVDDFDRCGIDNRDSLFLNIHIILPDNNEPVVLIDNDAANKDLMVRIGDELSYEVKALDADQKDEISLEAIGVGFNLADVGIMFQAASGFSSVKSELKWNIACGDVDLGKKNQYEILLIAEDGDKCKIPNADTIRLMLNIAPPLNNAPQILVNGATLEDTLYVDAGQKLDLNISGTDTDGDLLLLSMSNPNIAEALGVEFTDKTGEGFVDSRLAWQTTCELLGEEFGPGIYTFEILLKDEKCLVPMSDNLLLNVAVKDEKINYDVLLPNVFTPNLDDEINKIFYIPDLPGDNCVRQFKDVLIFNRWGKVVFSSQDRDFRWKGVDEPTGIYYYAITYTDFTMKGTVSILR